jgi:hypothetical protein
MLLLLLLLLGGGGPGNGERGSRAPRCYVITLTYYTHVAA